MKCKVESGDMVVEVSAETYEAATERALLDANYTCLGKIISIQCEGQEMRYTFTEGVLKKLAQDNRDLYARLTAASDIDGLIRDSKYGLRGNYLRVLWAAEALAQIGQLAIPKLIEALDDFALEARIATAQQMYYRGDLPQGTNYLDYLRHPMGAITIDREIQKRIKRKLPNPCAAPAFALTKIGDASVVPLCDYLAEEKDWIAREAAIWALGEIGDERAVPCLRKLVPFFSLNWLSRRARASLRKIKKRRRSPVPTLEEAMRLTGMGEEELTQRFMIYLLESGKNPFAGMSDNMLKEAKEKYPDIVDLARRKFGNI
jgi:hypothetical protein